MISIKELQEGRRVHGKFAIRTKETPREYKRKEGMYFFMTVGNKTGDIPLRYWGGADPEALRKLYSTLEVGDVIEVTGDIEYDRFSEQLVISVNEGIHTLRKCTPDEYNIEDFIPTTTKNLRHLEEGVMRLVNSVRDEHLSALLDSFFGDERFLSEFKKAPAAMVHHHNYVGGLIEHTYNVARICEVLCAFYPELNRDLLITAALLHDIGKLPAYVYTTSIEQSDDGRFIGHIILGDRILREKIEKIEHFPEQLKKELCHAIAMHHAMAEEGIPSRVKTPEACALHQADKLDAYVKNFLQAVEASRDMGTWVYDRTLGQEIYTGGGD